MDKSFLLQKQVKDNADDLQKEFLDMKNWEEQMKRKEETLNKEASGQMLLPPIRSKHKNKTKNVSTKQNASDTQSKRIKSYDYKAWDKFDIDKACKDVDKDEQSDESEGESMSKEELKKAYKEAAKHKIEGNAFVQQKEWSKAVGCYSAAIKIFPYDAIFYANRALCQLKLDNLYAAESDCSAAIQLDENYVKAYHRRATIRINLKQYKEAREDLKKVLNLEPSNKEAKSLLSQIENKTKCSQAVTVVRKETEESISKSTIEKKIGEKIWDKTIDIQNVKDPKYLEEHKDLKNIINSKQSQNDKADDVEQTVIERRKHPCIPDWLPEKENVVVIEPIEKPPHLRSKKLLTRIPVEEVDFSSVQFNRDIKRITLCKKKSAEKYEAHEEKIVKITSPKVEVSESTDDISTIPPVPKTAVHFVMTWKSHKSSEFRYKYLKQLPKNSIPKIFQDSMESDIFSEILEILRTEFINRNESVFHYLVELSQVRRFRALIMFISSKEKEGLRILFEHCTPTANISRDEICSLREKYEI